MPHKFHPRAPSNDKGESEMPTVETRTRPKIVFSLAACGARTLASFCGPLAFAFLGGYADASGYVLTGTFTGHITGSLVLAAIGAASRDWHSLFLRLGGVTTFLIGVAVAESLVQELQRKPTHHVLTLVIVIELLLFCLGYQSLAHHLNFAPTLLVACMSLAMGMQNGTWQRVGSGAGAHTTFITGLSVYLVAKETDEKILHSSKTSGQSALKTPLDIWVAFLLGAALGAVAAVHFHTRAILGAVLLLVLMMTASAIRLEPHSSANVP